MPVRFYIMPKVGDGQSPATAYRPKYADADSLQLGWRLAWTGLDYGRRPVYLIAADVASDQHALLSAAPDVVTFPADLSAAVGAAVATVQSRLRNYGLPGDWITETTTYRQVLSVTVRVFLIAQRLHGAFNLAVPVNNWQDGVGSIPSWPRIVEAAASLGAVGVIDEATPLRVALGTLAHRVGIAPVQFGGEAI